MREILFRGQYDVGLWAFGEIQHGSDPPHNPCLIRNYNTGVGFQVEPKTVGQYIGRTDKKGNKIFEGDIVQYLDADNIAVVRFNADSAMFDLQTADDEIKTFEDIWSGELEIIGNIYDNPELLEGE